MPGFGASQCVREDWGVEEYALWLKLFMVQNKLLNAHILAHSFGARVAILALATNAVSCDKLIITGGAGIVKPRSVAYMRQVKRYRRIKKFFPKYANKHFGSEEYKSLSPAKREGYKKIVNRDLRKEAALICCPTLLVYGKEDRVTPACEEGACFASLMPNATLKTICGGHFCFSQYPKQFNALALSFLNST